MIMSNQALVTPTQYFILFAATFILVGALTPVMRRLALKTNFVDQPNAAHKSHKEAIPYLGGVAIILGILIIIYAAIFTQNNLSTDFCSLLHC